MNKTKANTAKPFLSILIPTRNRAYYLHYAVQSALNIPSEEIEILVSENHSSDNSKEILAGFSDPRLKIMAPDSPLPMHENWEFLLSKSTGEWVYFLGDDDAMMPHSVKYLKKIVDRYPRIEAIVSPRAYYFWDGLQDKYGETCISLSFSSREIVRDSKKMLNRCLDGSEEYVSLPQFYSGGFQRKTLVNRIKRAQSGIYFKSVTPDAYSALASVLHTFRYLEIGVPLAWVGSSPDSNSKAKNISITKNRSADFTGMHSDENLVLNYALGEFRNITFTLCFYEAYLSAFPNTNYRLMSQAQLKHIFFDFRFKFRNKTESDAVHVFAKEIGFTKFSNYSIGYYLFSAKRKIQLTIARLSKLLSSAFGGNASRQTTINFRSTDHGAFPDILSFDQKLGKIFNQWEIDNNEKCDE